MKLDYCTRGKIYYKKVRDDATVIEKRTIDRKICYNCLEYIYENSNAQVGDVREITKIAYKITYEEGVSFSGVERENESNEYIK